MTSRPDNISQEAWGAAFHWMDDAGFISAFYSDEDEATLQRTLARAIMGAKAEAREESAAYHDNLAAQHYAVADTLGLEGNDHRRQGNQHLQFAADIRKPPLSPQR